MKTFLALSFLILSSAHAQSLSYGSYIKMQESLAADDFKTSLDTHKTICEKELQHFKSDYKDCSKEFKGIEELRSSFKTLSEVYIKHGDKKELKGLITASCPMANGKWIQKNSSLKNPYYGKSMLECGEKI